jgi:hypothetical protein
VERRRNAFGNDARAKSSGCSTIDPPLEDKLDMVWSSDVEVLANNLFEEYSAGDRPIENLGQ